MKLKETKGKLEEGKRKSIVLQELLRRVSIGNKHFAKKKNYTNSQAWEWCDSQVGMAWGFDDMRMGTGN